MQKSPFYIFNMICVLLVMSYDSVGLWLFLMNKKKKKFGNYLSFRVPYCNFLNEKVQALIEKEKSMLLNERGKKEDALREER